jgi:hypothetical protein
MGRYKGRTETSRHGFIPDILDTGDERVEAMLDHAYVEYGTGCWVDKGTIDTQLTYDLQEGVWEAEHGYVPEGHWVVNVCSDFRICYNPNCLIVVDLDDLSDSGRL